MSTAGGPRRRTERLDRLANNKTYNRWLIIVILAVAVVMLVVALARGHASWAVAGAVAVMLAIGIHLIRTRYRS
jgi:hypothetical protein